MLEQHERSYERPVITRDENASIIRELKTLDNFQTSPIVTTTKPFDNAIVSWNLEMYPEQSCILQMRVWDSHSFSPWVTTSKLNEGRLVQARPQRYNTITIEDSVITSQKLLHGFQMRAIADPSMQINSVTVAHIDSYQSHQLYDTSSSNAWGINLPVPQRSQFGEHPGIQERLCSPTAVAIILEYYGRYFSTEQIAGRVFDSKLDEFGVPVAAAAVAAHLLKRDAYIAQMQKLKDLENQIATGKPIMVAYSWEEGELLNAPFRASEGHCAVVKGFTKKGNVIVNETGIEIGSTQTVYARKQFYHAWQNTGGLALVIT